MQYRRDLTAGATYFFTVVTFRCHRFFAHAENIERLRAAMRDEKVRRPIQIDAVFTCALGYIARSHSRHLDIAAGRRRLFDASAMVIPDHVGYE